MEPPEPRALLFPADTPPDGARVSEVERASKILVVDDDRPTAEFVRAHLKAAGYFVAVADSEASAIQACALHMPDLIVLSAVLGGQGSLTLYRRLVGSQVEGKASSVIFLLPEADAACAARALSAGADGYVSKPVHEADLLLRARELLRIRRMRSEVAELNELVHEQRAQLERLRSFEDLPAVKTELPVPSERSMIQKLEQQLADQRDAFELLLHDFSGALSLITTGADLLLEESSSVSIELADALQDMSAQARDVREYVEDLRAVAQGEQLGLVPRLDLIELDALVDEVHARVRLSRRAVGAELEVEVPPDLYVRADSKLLRRVLQNLLVNALRFTPADGTILLSAWRHKREMCIAVRHTGTPIPEAIRQRLFEKFAPREAEGRPQRGGLGLYFCRRAVEAHGGTISHLDVEGWAVSFEMRLPLVGADQRERLTSGLYSVAARKRDERG